MWPMVFGIKTYTVFYGLSILCHPAVACWYCRRMGIRLRTGMLLGLCYLFGMIIGARMLHDLLHWQFGGLEYLRIRYYLAGGLWGGPLAYLAVAVPAVLVLGRGRKTLVDLVVLSLPAPMIVAKVACFFNGCCYGVPSELPWAVAFPEGAVAPAGVPRHPTELYEILVLVVILVLFHVLDRRRWKGMLLLWFVAIYGVGRPLTELFRGDSERTETMPSLGPLTASQTACLVAAAVSAVALLALYRRTADSRRTGREQLGAPSTRHAGR